MIATTKVDVAARKLEKENLRFRIWLKNHADDEKLDMQFRRLHEKLFVDYDCRQCANCCRKFQTVVLPGEICAMAGQLGMAVPDFIRDYTIMVEDDGVQSRGFDAPCPMLMEDGGCRVQDCKPGECRAFPYTDRPGRLGSMYSVLNFARVCPVVFEILQRLKQMYGFRGR